MAIRQYDIPSIDVDGIRGKRDYFMLGSMQDLAQIAPEASNFGFNSGPSFVGHVSRAEALAALHTGRVADVAMSDKFLGEVESLFPAPTTKHEIIDDVTGAFPNVPAYIAGQPMNMRRKVKRANEFSPLAVVVDLTSSASISAKTLAKRGAAILALVRAMSGRRPVELHVGVGLDAHYSSAIWQFWQVETQPLDLARAAFVIGNPAACRGVMYGLAQVKHKYNGNFPYRVYPTGYREHMNRIVARAFPHISDVLVVPAIQNTDEAVTDPVKWIGDMVKTYSEPQLDAEAA